MNSDCKRRWDLIVVIDFADVVRPFSRGQTQMICAFKVEVTRKKTPNFRCRKFGRFVFGTTAAPASQVEDVGLDRTIMTRVASLAIVGKPRRHGMRNVGQV